MKNLAIARRYARALILIGQEDGKTDTYGEELGGFAGIMETEKGLAEAVTNPLYNADGRRRVLSTVVETLGVSDTMKSFLVLLFDKGRIGFIGSINENFQKMADEIKGIARATLTSATTLPDDTIDKIRESLSKLTGKEVVLGVEQDPGLIGGIVTRIGDLVLDGSVRTQLLNMRETLKRGESV